MSLHIVILAAGQGKRMHSATPKVLHPLGDKPLLTWVIEAARLLNPEAIHVIIGYEGEQIKQALPAIDVHWVLQTQQLGTGHAVMQALTYIPDDGHVLVLSADVPLITAETLQALVHRLTAPTDQPALCLLLATLTDPTGMGRIMRNEQGNIRAIIEEKDASPLERQLNEIYSGICCAKAKDLKRWLPQLGRQNAQGEYYLTEIIAMAVAEGGVVDAFHVADPIEIQGVNNRLQLQTLERVWQARIASTLMLAGVTLADASRLDVRGTLQCDNDVFIDVNTVFKGNVVIGEGSRIGPNCYLDTVEIGKHCDILPNSVLEHSKIGDHCHVGPFARLRPGTELAEHCKIGNFVETKNAVFDEHSKASHLSYLGDVSIGKDVNIGAGTITCNYDGADKHQTIIEDGVFIGSDTQLIAPVVIGKNATIAAGSTIIKDVPANQLTLTEAKQKSIPGWVRPKKHK